MQCSPSPRHGFGHALGFCWALIQTTCHALVESSVTSRRISMRLNPLLIALVLVAGFALAQQAAQQPVIANPEEAKLVSSPSLPDCYSYALERGDPRGSSSVALGKLTAGCTVPWHYHSANEQVVIVNGAAQLQAKGEPAKTLTAGTYFYMPAHHQHQFSCQNGCEYQRWVDGPVDIHYVDAAGNEISAATALAAVGERPGAAAAQK
jgi:quercetin dioxygenase-like cupin family protein